MFWTVTKKQVVMDIEQTLYLTRKDTWSVYWYEGIFESLEDASKAAWSMREGTVRKWRVEEIN